MPRSKAAPARATLRSTRALFTPAAEEAAILAASSEASSASIRVFRSLSDAMAPSSDFSSSARSRPNAFRRSMNRPASHCRKAGTTWPKWPSCANLSWKKKSHLPPNRRHFGQSGRELGRCG